MKQVHCVKVGGDFSCSFPDVQRLPDTFIRLNKNTVRFSSSEVGN